MGTTFNWSGLSPDAINRIAGARRKRNAEQQRLAWARRDEIINIVTAAKLPLFARGLQATLAARFGVNPSTVCRDLRAIIARWREVGICSKCGEPFQYTQDDIERYRREGIIQLMMRFECTKRRCAASYRAGGKSPDEVAEPIGFAARLARL